MNDGAMVICVVGGDGSGKTTQIERLTAFFEKQDRNVVPVTIWDALLTRLRYRNSPSRGLQTSTRT